MFRYYLRYCELLSLSQPHFPHTILYRTRPITDTQLDKGYDTDECDD